MPKRKPSGPSSRAPRRPKRGLVPGKHARADGLRLRSYDVGALTLLDRIAERMHLRRILGEHLPSDDSRTELPTVTALLVLFADLLMAREPVYGVAEWAALFPPDLLGLHERDPGRSNDDRLGRSLDRMEARRPDLKQLRYILTVTSDGSVPIDFASTASTHKWVMHRSTLGLHVGRAGGFQSGSTPNPINRSGDLRRGEALLATAHDLLTERDRKGAWHGGRPRSSGEKDQLLTHADVNHANE